MQMSGKKTNLLLIAFALISCSDNQPIQVSASTADATRLSVPPVDAGVESDLQFLPPTPIIDAAPPPPTREEICAQTPTYDVDNYCSCFPDCCDRQRWYCPPNAQQTIDVMQVIVEVCDDNKVPCSYGIDEMCPPPEILSQSDCVTQWHCPPGTTGEFIRWFECQLEDGTTGRQKVTCNKGDLLHGPCLPCVDELCDGEDNDCDDLTDEGFFPCETECGQGLGVCRDGEVVDCVGGEPGEERCNQVDDDCDGQVDEGQTNACGECGPLPAETCNNVDDDCDDSTDEELIRECETACERGVETCQDGNWISCTAQRPEDEQCDGLDNDCDSQIDEGLNCLCTVQDVGVLQPCSEPPLLCGQGFKTCECVDEACLEFRMTDCQALCVYLPIPEPPACNPQVGMVLEEELCNAFDEDCDQALDEGLTQACYTGDPETVLIGVCVPGEVYCHMGAWGGDVDGQFTPGFCDGEVTPQREICDGADNDCDGVTDYGEEIRETDILFIVDWSGSMDDEIAAVRTALNQFAQQFAAEEALHWGLIIGPKNFEEAFNPPEWLLRVTDIVPFDQFLQAFAALGNEGMDTGDEMLMDAIYFAINNIGGDVGFDIPAARWIGSTSSNPEKENFRVTWRPNADRIIVLFTDEGPQSFLEPEVTSEMLVQGLSNSINLKFYAFVEQGIEGNLWGNMIGAGGGERFLLTSNANDMYNDLMSIIDEACLPRQEEEQGAFFFGEYSGYTFSSGVYMDHGLLMCY